MQDEQRSYQNINVGGDSRVHLGHVYQTIHGESDTALARFALTNEYSERPVTPPLPFSTVPFERDPDHVDRSALSEDLRTKLRAPGARVALVGLGGVG